MHDDYEEGNSRGCQFILLAFGILLALAAVPLSVVMMIRTNDLDGCEYRVDIVFATIGSTIIAIIGLLMTLSSMHFQSIDQILKPILTLGLLLPLSFLTIWWFFLGFLNECKEKASSVVMYWTFLLIGTFFGVWLIIAAFIELFRNKKSRHLRTEHIQKQEQLISSFVDYGHHLELILKNKSKHLEFILSWVKVFERTYLNEEYFGVWLSTTYQNDPLLLSTIAFIFPTQVTKIDQSANILCSVCEKKLLAREAAWVCQVDNQNPHFYHQQCMKRHVAATTRCKVCNSDWRGRIQQFIYNAKTRLESTEFFKEE